MWLQDRHQKIMNLLGARKRLSTETISEELEVSRETIRRDLLELESSGLLKRVHGGVVLPDTISEEPFNTRVGTHQREKKIIAKLAASLVRPGQCVMIDAGTTTKAFAEELALIPNISVITNSIDVAIIMKHSRQENETLLLGGRMHTDVPATYGELTLSELSRFNADVAIISPVALHPDLGASNYALHEAEVAKLMIAKSGNLILLADESKINTTSKVQFCDTADIDTLVTNAKPEAEIFKALSSSINKIVCA